MMLFAPKVFPKLSTLSHAGRSMYVWVFYTFPLAFTLLLVPGLFLQVMGISPGAADGNLFFMRMAGGLLVSMSFMSHQAAVLNMRQFFVWAVMGRTFITLVLIVCTVLGLCEPIIMFFGCIDFSGGMWTLVGIRRDEAEEQARALGPQVIAQPSP
ncbi:hypothetical protein D7Y21_14150 [Corallococcus sp. AB045]|uniref:hypothetical protein n=1 Tax=Corallococcus sp. AB045 TaxID=2316719 RepID=UPI000EF0662C|nr:hypothetical protein [Corallococcus sp. AB045]RKH88644.1 hypothetical protein D7Y21_14150 [Corallococcus sp. AB045]